MYLTVHINVDVKTKEDLQDKISQVVAELSTTSLRNFHFVVNKVNYALLVDGNGLIEKQGKYGLIVPTPTINYPRLITSVFIYEGEE